MAAVLVALAAMSPAMADEATQGSDGQSDPAIPANDDAANSQEHDGTVDEEGEATVTLFSPGSQADPAISVTFDGAGRAVITSNLAPVEVREIVAVPAQYRDVDPHYDGACLLTHTIMVITGQQAATQQAYEQVIRFTTKAIFPGILVDIPDCVVRPGQLTDDPTEAFQDMLGPFIQQLPRPTPVLNPESAITGLDTYLQTNRPLAYGPVGGQIVLGGTPFDVTLWAEGAYTVDWGQHDDGHGEAFQQVTGPHTIPGRAYQRGRSHDDDAVTHVYTSKPDGPLSVSVTDYWIVHYTIAGVVDDATIVAELQPVSVPVQVREYQAVLVNE